MTVTGDDKLNLSPDCDQASASFKPPPLTVNVYPCAEGVGTISLRYDGDSVTWTRTTQVLAPRYVYSITVTSQTDTQLVEPTALCSAALGVDLRVNPYPLLSFFQRLAELVPS